MPNSKIGTSSIDGLGYGFKNRIINGAMMIDQRNAGASVTPSNNQFITDRWKINYSGNFTCQQNAGSVTPPTGFTNYLGATSTGTNSPTGNITYSFVQVIEGFNVADLGWGTANAQPVALSFWVRSSATGTFGGSFQNSAGNRSYPFSYTISAANTWEQKTISIAGDTTGTWVKDNGIGLTLTLCMGGGANYAGTAGAWGGADYRTVSGQTNALATSGATFYITGVQLEKGSTATSFDYRPYGTELQLCQRYYETGTLYAQAYGNSSNGVNWSYPMKVTKRALPTGTLTSGGYVNYPGPVFFADDANTVYLTNSSVPSTGFVRAIVTFNISSEL